MDQSNMSLNARRMFLSIAGLGSAAAVVGTARNALATSSVEGTIPVARVTDFSTIQAAADSLTDGGILYFPEGTYPVASPIALRSNTWACGAGPGSVLLCTGTSPAIFSSTNVESIRISHLAFDVDANVDGVAAILFHNGSGPCSDLTIEKCTFFTTTPISVGDVGYAVYVEGAAQVRVLENTVFGLDIVASDGTGGPGVTVKNNHVVEASNHAIAVRGRSGDVLDSVVIDGNLIESPGAMGIVVGSPIESDLLESVTSVSVRGNIVTGTIGGIGILARLAETTTDLVVDGNIVSNDTVVANSLGIRVSGDATGSTVRGLTVRGNSVRIADHAGITVAGSGSGVLICGNAVEGTRGISVAATNSGLADVVVANNVVRAAGVQGIRLGADLGDLRGVMVNGNQVLDTIGWSSLGIRLVAASGKTLSGDIRGNRCSDTKSTKTQFYGVGEEGAGTFDTRYLENDLTDNLYGGFGAVNSAAAIEDNAGVITESRGIASIGTAGVATITHGLAYAPAVSDISLSLAAPPASWTSSNAGQFWLVSAAPTSFIVACSPLPLSGETVQVTWQARIRTA
ncbi:MAG: right-handed parallel beta-helix repeat-containing protein [Polyangiaceae bacterium]|nr:right-handed parallel beta-helix repeat-containing protein [Polyangiaceae bacterium]